MTFEELVKAQPAKVHWKAEGDAVYISEDNGKTWRLYMYFPK